MAGGLVLVGLATDFCVNYSAVDAARLGFKVRVIDGSAGTSANVRVLIESRDRDDIWSTVGVSEDIIFEAIELALADMTNVNWTAMQDIGAEIERLTNAIAGISGVTNIASISARTGNQTIQDRNRSGGEKSASVQIKR